MSNLSARQDDNQFPALITHTGTAGTADIMRLAGEGPGLQRTILYALAFDGPLVGQYVSIQAKYNTGIEAYELLTYSGGTPPAPPIAQQLVGLLGAFTYPD